MRRAGGVVAGLLILGLAAAGVVSAQKMLKAEAGAAGGVDLDDAGESPMPLGLSQGGMDEDLL